MEYSELLSCLCFSERKRAISNVIFSPPLHPLLSQAKRLERQEEGQRQHKVDVEEKVRLSRMACLRSTFEVRVNKLFLRSFLGFLPS